MATPNYNLPTISGNMTADVVRDMNALAEATDSAIKEAIDNVDLSGINTKLDTHIKDDLGHVRFYPSTGIDSVTVKADDIPMVDPNVTSPTPKTGVAIRFTKVANNTGAMTFRIVRTNNTKPTSDYPLLNSRGGQLSANTLVNNGIYTVSFNGTAFILQGESGVTTVTRGNQTFSTPGSHKFIVPDGVSLITCYMFGAGGGGGGGGTIDGSPGNSAGGGGGGAFALRMLEVVPGNTINITVGYGGAGGFQGYNGSSGGYTSVTFANSDNTTVNYYAFGGGAGGGGNTGTGRGGAGGTTTASGQSNVYTNTVDGGLVGSFQAGKILQAYSGGGGGYSGQSYTGGGGGSAPSDILPGKGASGGTAGSNSLLSVLSVRGGDGGGGGSGAPSQAREGQSPGGGGGGGAGSGGVVAMIGAKGGDGRVMLYW